MHEIAEKEMFVHNETFMNRIFDSLDGLLHVGKSPSVLIIGTTSLARIEQEVFPDGKPDGFHISTSINYEGHDIAIKVDDSMQFGHFIIK